jgi:hypothetical protein
MSDTVAYILILGLIALPTAIGVAIANRIMEFAFENQSVLLALPFP